jgi:hypothetical protein
MPRATRSMRTSAERTQGGYHLIQAIYNRTPVFIETAIHESTREAVLRHIASGQVDCPIKVLAFDDFEGWARDVSEDIAREIINRAAAAGEKLCGPAYDFCGRHLVRELLELGEAA